MTIKVVKSKHLKKEWVLKYFNTNDVVCVDILNRHFVDAYIVEFNPKYAVMPYGANKCSELGKLLSEMYHEGLLTRSTIGLANMYVGYPKWVYVYSKV